MLGFIKLTKRRLKFVFKVDIWLHWRIYPSICNPGQHHNLRVFRHSHSISAHRELIVFGFDIDYNVILGFQTPYKTTHDLKAIRVPHDMRAIRFSCHDLRTLRLPYKPCHNLGSSKQSTSCTQASKWTTTWRETFKLPQRPHDDMKTLRFSYMPH